MESRHWWWCRRIVISTPTGGAWVLKKWWPAGSVCSYVVTGSLMGSSRLPALRPHFSQFFHALRSSWRWTDISYRFTP
ncbi:hypothetical protein EYF80_065440 [Liparis tanakae]|uniref:Uncharacterized protein n=1 Tax=Liparis tanakae TaxID=230148 RepID=A0A4Z2E6N3_9TELE|nr:hypothetical protein EYF80_065440 [Liparis tanakae]